MASFAPPSTWGCGSAAASPSSSTITAHFNRPVRTLTGGIPDPGTEVGGENTLMGVKVGNELLAGLGVSWGVVPFIFDLVGELYTFTGLGLEEGSTPTAASRAWGRAARRWSASRPTWRPTRSSRRAAATACSPPATAPTQGRFFVGFVFEPGVGDRDGDGIKDDVDKCPDDPEDFDDFEDEDGCPDPGQRPRRHPRRRSTSARTSPDPRRRDDGCPDATRSATATATASPTTSTSARTSPRTSTASRTRTAAPIPTTTRTASPTSSTSARTIPRTRTASRTRTAARIRTTTRTASSTCDDKCPNEPETYNGFEDEDGCPDKGLVIVQRGKLEILDKIYFETDKDDHHGRCPSRSSTPSRRPSRATREIALIEIQGHADERGDDEYNLDLTDRRAHSVMRALEDRGVELGRLQRPRLRRDPAGLHPAQRGLLEQEPPRRVHHPQARGRGGSPRRRWPVVRSSCPRRGRPNFFLTGPRRRLLTTTQFPWGRVSFAFAATREN